MARMTKNSNLVFKSATMFTFQKCSDGIEGGEVWFHIWGSVDLWNHVLSDASGPIIFQTMDDAVSFLLKKKIPLEKMNLKEIYESGKLTCMG